MAMTVSHEESVRPHSHSPQNTEADFSILVDVGVEPDHASSRGHELDSWGDKGVGGGEPNEKVKVSTFVRGVKRTCY